MAQSATTRRNASTSGSSRLSLSVGKATSTSQNPGRHPLKHDWSISYVHRSSAKAGNKAGIDYEKEIKRVATFGSIESFLHLYSHLTPISELTPITDILIFLSRIGRPGMWEEMRDGGRFTIKLVQPITPILFETLLFGMIGDQFEESDSVVGCVVSKRSPDGDILSVWVEGEGESVKSGQLREKIISLLNLPQGTVCEYKSNKVQLDAAVKLQTENQESTPHRGYHHHTSNYNHHNNQHNRDNRDRGDRGGDRGGDRERDNHQGERQNAAPRAYHRRDEEGGGERKEPREPRANGWNRS